MIAPRLIGLCDGRPMLAVEESQFPMGCSWIEPIASLAPYAFALVGAVALAVVFVSVRRGLRAGAAIVAELATLERMNP